MFLTLFIFLLIHALLSVEYCITNDAINFMFITAIGNISRAGEICLQMEIVEFIHNFNS